jgi:hypothetical protein
MTNAKRDNNYIPAPLAISNADGSTPIPFCSNPTDHTLCAVDGETGSDLSASDNAQRDENAVPVALAVSSSDGVTPVQLYIDSVTKKLLIQTT